VNENLTRALLITAVLASTAIAGCASTDGSESSAASRESSGASQQTPGEVVDDGVVTAKVKAKLVDDPVTKAYQINVETFKGTVQLSGFVDSAEASSRAAQLAGQVGGVKDVENSLEVRKPDG
jgi:osmotically-inducible protein OsmY